MNRWNRVWAAVMAVLLVGWFSAEIPAGARVASAISSMPSKFVPMSPTRVMDTRINQGNVPAGKPRAGGTTHLHLAGVGTIPANATAVVLNVTATETDGAGFLTVFPAGGSRPLASNLNIERTSQTIPNLVTVPVGSGGQVAFFTQMATHVIADVFGYYVPASASTDGRFVPTAPTRLYDSRERRDPWPGDHTQDSPVGPSGRNVAAGGRAQRHRRRCIRCRVLDGHTRRHPACDHLEPERRTPRSGHCEPGHRAGGRRLDRCLFDAWWSRHRRSHGSVHRGERGVVSRWIVRAHCAHTLARYA